MLTTVCPCMRDFTTEVVPSLASRKTFCPVSLCLRDASLSFENSLPLAHIWWLMYLLFLHSILPFSDQNRVAVQCMMHYIFHAPVTLKKIRIHIHRIGLNYFLWILIKPDSFRLNLQVLSKQFSVYAFSSLFSNVFNRN